jgi:hypothetical protein
VAAPFTSQRNAGSRSKHVSVQFRARMAVSRNTALHVTLSLPGVNRCERSHGDGSMMTVIISVHTAVKGPMPSPKVPGIVPICRATTMLPSQAAATPRAETMPWG